LVIQYQTACELAHEFPAQLAQFMDLEMRIGRGRFREETMTDLLLAALVRLPGAPLELITPPENATGSDFDVVIVDLMGKTQVGYRIQAKRLSLGAVHWDRNSFKELAHKGNTGSQFATLTNAQNLAGPPPLTALYAFYIPHSICKLSSMTVEGIHLAAAQPVSAAIRDVQAKVASNGRSQAKQLRNLSPHFFSLREILCPSTPSTGLVGRSIASPRESADQTARAMRRSSQLSENVGSAPQVVELPADDAVRLNRLRRPSDDLGTVPIIRRRGLKRTRLILDGTPR
jgi:hypothetical protein